MAVLHIATLAELSPAHFNRASNLGAWEYCLSQVSTQLRGPMPSCTVELYAILIEQAQLWVPKLEMYPKSQAHLRKALEVESADDLTMQIMDWHVSWRDAVVALRRYWLHYLKVYSYTSSPDLSEYFFRLALSTALLKWLCAVHQVQSMAAAAEQLSCVERIIEHASLNTKAIAPFQNLDLSLKSIIVGLVL